MNWITAPLTIYAVLAVVISITLALFLTMRIQQGQVQRRLAERCGRLEEEVLVCRSLLAQGSPMPSQATAAPPQPKDDGLDIFKRRRALALYEEGQSAGRIASELGLPRNQVLLLGKVRRALAHF